MGRVLVDDLDNTVHNPDDGKEVLNWNFGLGPANAMKTYSIDLTAENFAKIEEALAPFVKVAAEVERQPATRPSAPRKASTPSRNTGEPSKAAQIREWAKAEGYEVSPRGRIHKDIIEKYEYAMESEKRGTPEQ